MQLRELRVRRLPGIDTPFTLEAVAGVNLIVGPNGSGKSSLCRTVRALLWPHHESFTPLDVASSWEVQGDIWRASRQGQSDVQWQHAGAAVDAPTVPGDQLARAYRLEIVDLLKTTPGATDRELAEEIRTRMAGGFNLDTIARDLCGDRPRVGLKEHQELRVAAQRVRKLRSEQQQLAGAENELQTLRQQLDVGREAACLLPLWRKRRELVTVNEQLARAANEREGFPPVLTEMTGNEPQQLAEVVRQRRQKRDDLAQPTARIATAERQLAAAELPAGPPEPATLETWQERARVCGELQLDLRRAERELAEKKARLASVGDTLSAEWTTAATETIPAETVAEVAAYLDASRPLRARSDALAKVAADVNLAPAALPHSPETIAQGSQLLLDWLAAAAVPYAGRGQYAAAAGVALLCGAGLVTSLVLDRSWGWLLAAAGGGGLAIVLLWIAAGTWSRSRSVARRRECVQRFGETGLPEPPSWTRSGVRQALARLQTVAAAGDLEGEKTDLRQRLADEHDELARQLAEQDEIRAELIQRCGLAPTAADATLTEFSRRVAAFHAARQEYDGAAGRVADLRQRLAADLQCIGEFLDSYAAVPAAESTAAAAGTNSDPGSQPLPQVAAQRTSALDTAAVEAGLRGLARRGDEYRRAVDSLAADRVYRQRISAELAELDRKHDAVYERLHLVPGDEDGLARLVGQLTEYRSIKSEHERAQREQARLQGEVAQIHAAAEQELGAPLETATESLSRHQLDDLIARDDQLAGQVDRLSDRLARIDERVQQARGGASLTEALAARTAAAERLNACRTAAEDAAMGKALLAAVSGEHEEISRPPLLERTRELLRTFTHDSYELSVATGTDGALFRVTETTSGRSLGLEQLSAGTRAQLLLAARLAYLLAAESNETLPLFLDESLTAADPERFAAVVDGLAAIAADEQRQIFYLTSDPADVARWQVALREANRPPPAVVDLGELRGLAAAAPAAELALPPPATVPASGGLDAAAYGRLISVPRLDPFAATDSIHLFYLLRDRLDLLESLLQRRIGRLGQWRGGSPLRRSGLASGDIALLDARVAMVDAFFAAWRIGRGRPVDRQALAASAAVSERYLDEILALNRAVGRDGAALVARLIAGDVKGFRRGKATALDHYLTAHGYTDPRPVLEIAVVLERVLEAVASRLERGELSVRAVTTLVYELSATVAGPDEA